MLNLLKLLLGATGKFLVNLLLAATSEKFVADTFFSAFEHIASKTNTDTDDKICKDMQEAYMAYMEKKNG